MHNSLTPDRSELRARLRAQRAALSPRERMAAAEALAEVLDQLPEFVVDARVAGYWAIGGEMPLHAAYARLRAREQRYFLPVIDANDALRFAPWQPGAALRTNRYGIPEPDVAPAELLTPQQLDLVLVPLLGYDRNGNRLGMGAGYYDRTFEFLRGVPRPAQPVLAGIGYHFQEVPALAPQPWDVPLDFIATERELIACGEGLSAEG
jgi:5-formyltetrahydrofolate cyclo-ligase